MAICTVANTAPSYTITEIGYIEPVDINNSGMVFGNGIVDVEKEKTASSEVYLWSKNTDLVTLKGLSEERTTARKINNLGQCLGESYNTKTTLRCVRWDNDHSIHELSKTMWNACGINDSGQVAGISLITGGFPRAVIVDSKGTLTELPPLTDDEGSQANGINKYGVVVGQSYGKGGANRKAVLWSPENDAPILLETLESAGGSCPTDINDKGISVGSVYFNNSGTHRAVLWDADGLITELGWNGTANAINNSGTVIGDRGGRPMIWKKGVMTDLSTLIPENSGWVISTATGINDSGCIVGKGTLNGEQMGYLLTPCL